jgi:nucleoside-diphosphate-sugar epimerase
MNLLIFGLGYSAQRLCHLHARSFVSLAGTVRTVEKAAMIDLPGVSVRIWPGAPHADDTEILHGADHILISVPPGEHGDPVLARLGEVLRRRHNLKWIGYWSSIAVYPDAGGGWVDETAVCAPVSLRGKARLAAEIGWAELSGDLGVPIDILRLPGIYGPGRSAIESVRTGTARRIIKPGQVFNRIHVDDIAGATLAALQSATTSAQVGSKPALRIINVTDDLPTPPQDVVSFAAKLLALPEPPAVDFDTAELSVMARSFYADTKRASNRRLKDELGYRLLYPTYREGLRAIASTHAA